MKKIKNSFFTFGIIMCAWIFFFALDQPVRAASVSFGAKKVQAKSGQSLQLTLPEHFVLTKDTIFQAAKARADYVRKKKFNYGDARKNPAFNDSEKLVSCDRYVQWVLHDLGFQDLPADSGLFVYSLNPDHDFPSWCTRHGFVRITDIHKVKAGDIIFLKNPKSGKPDHVFILGESQGNGFWQRYDCGSQSRIRSVQPFSYEPVEYDIHPFAFAYRMLSPKVTWTSSNPKIAVPNASGRVTALRPGSCTIYAVSGSRSFSFSLTVSNARPRVSSEKKLSRHYSGMAVIAGKTYLVKNGRKYTGYYTLNGTRYYVKNGRKYTGFRHSSKKAASKKTCYYLRGIRVKGLRTIKGRIYFFNSKGIMQKGWKKIRGKRYYFRANGRAAKGWVKIRGRYYYFSKKNGTLKKIRSKA